MKRKFPKGKCLECECRLDKYNTEPVRITGNQVPSRVCNKCHDQGRESFLAWQHARQML